MSDHKLEERAWDDKHGAHMEITTVVDGKRLSIQFNPHTSDITAARASLLRAADMHVASRPDRKGAGG